MDQEEQGTEEILKIILEKMISLEIKVQEINTSSNSKKEYLTRKEVAEITGFSTGHLANLATGKDGPPFIKNGERGTRRYPRKKLYLWINSRMKE